GGRAGPAPPEAVRAAFRARCPSPRPGAANRQRTSGACAPPKRERFPTAFPCCGAGPIPLPFRTACLTRRLAADYKTSRKGKRVKAIETKRKSQPLRVPEAGSALQNLSLAHGKRVRLWRLLYASGPANGTLLVLPLDQGLEHGPADFFPNPEALDPDFQFRLAVEGNYSAIALGIGLAEKYMREYAGRVPLILKLNGKTNIPAEDDERSPAGYRALREAAPARLRRVVRSAGRVMVLFSGGVKQDDDDAVLRKVKTYMECGAAGVMFGRNMWLRSFDHALALTRQV